MTLPQRVSYVTLGARNMTVLRSFYTGLGWVERSGSDDEFATYEMGSTLLALYPLGLLSEEAAPGEDLPRSSWSGVTLGINVHSRDAVDSAFETALRAGATSVARPVQRQWGGYSGYIADPEGHRWEITWAPGA
jgi:predicted lactoylglutathione lyase